MAKAINKNIGIALSIFFGAHIFGYLFNLVPRFFNWYDQTVALLIWVIINILSVGVMFFLARKAIHFSNPYSKISAYLLFALYCIFTVNNITAQYLGFNAFSFMGQYASILLETFNLILLMIFFIGLKTTNAVKAFGVISYAPSIIAALQIIKLQNAYDNFNAVDEFDFFVEKITNSIVICEYCSLILTTVALVASIIWANSKPVAPSVQNQPIDLI